VTENFDLGFSGRASNSLSRITGDAFDPATFASFPSPLQTRIDTLSYAARGTAHLTLGPVDQTLGLDYSSTVTSDRDPDNGSIPSSGDRIKLDWQGQVEIAEGELVVLGAETGRDAIHVPLSAGITTNAGFGEFQSSATNLFGGNVDFHNSISVRYDDNSRFGSKTTWHVAPVLAFKDTGTRLHATYGTGFKAPSLEQLFLSFPAFFFFANPNLKPETSTGYDVGFDQDIGHVSSGLTWFHNNIKNLIETDPVTFSSDVNIGRARTEGIEAYLAWQPRDTLKLRTDYTYTEAEDADLNQRLVRRPKNKFSADAQWQALEALSLDLSLIYVGSWIDGSRDFSVSRLHAHPYWTADLATSYALTDTLALTARINNLFDKRYENPVGFQGPGIGLYGGIKASF